MCDIRTGVELELWVVDSDGALTDGQSIVDAHEQIQPEFIDPLIEIQTAPHVDKGSLRQDLRSTLRAGLRAADEQDKRLVPLGTPLTPSDAQVNCKRGDLFETIYGAGIQSAKNCAGTHIHFQKDRVIDQLNLLTALDPALALLNSSPYYCGENGDLSSRARAYRMKPGRKVRRFCDLWGYAGSLEEWTNRIDRAYEHFKTLAVRNGIAVETVSAHFEPENVVLNPVRLRTRQPTVEWRAPDAALPSDVIELAVDVGELVSQTRTKTLEYGRPGVHPDRLGLPEFSTLRELSEHAIHFGLESEAVTTYLEQMGFDLSKYQPAASELNGPAALSDREARELRLEQADRLRNDLKAPAV